MSSLILYLDILYKTFLEVGRPSTLKDLVIWTLSLEVLDGVFTFCFVLSTRVSSFSALPQKPDNIYTLRILQQNERKMRRSHVLIFQDCLRDIFSVQPLIWVLKLDESESEEKRALFLYLYQSYIVAPSVGFETWCNLRRTSKLIKCNQDRNQITSELLK